MRDDGVSIAGMMEATGWLQHTTRAALTGLRKRGYMIERIAQENGPSLYRATLLGANIAAA